MIYDLGDCFEVCLTQHNHMKLDKEDLDLIRSKYYILREYLKHNVTFNKVKIIVFKTIYQTLDLNVINRL